MGFSIKAPKIKIKAPKIKVKTGIKAIDKGISAVSKTASSIASGAAKVASGKVSEGFGDIGQSAASMGLDIATGGNKSLVDSFTGGALTSAEMAARGNSSDILRTGLTVGSAFAGGPGTAMTVNSALASGNTAGGVMSLLAGSQGGNVDFLSDIGGFLNSDSALSKIANQAISGGIGKLTAKPVKVVKSNSSAAVAAQSPSGGNDMMKWGMIGGGVLLLAVVGMMAMRK